MVCRFSMLAASVALALGSATASAAGVDDIFSVRGYGTLGGLYSSQDEGDYVRDIFSQPEGAGHSHSVSAEVDSKTAIQVDAKFNDRFSAVVQIVSEAMYNNSWDGDPQKMWYPSLEWANVSYRITDGLTVRGGRIVLPFLMSADYQKVGYANHWMRSPIELYGKLAYTSLDGGDAWYEHALGDGTNTVRVYGGKQRAERGEPFSSFKTETFGILDAYEIGSLTVRAAYQHTTVDTGGAAAAAPFRGLQGAFTLVGATAAARKADELGDTMQDGMTVEMASVGVSYDVGDWFVSGELFKGWGSPLIPKHTSGYVSGGVRRDKWTPYATIAHTETKDFEDFIPTHELAGPLLIGAQMTNAGFAPSVAYSQTTASVGVRWDVITNVAVKAQYDYVALPSDSYGMFINRQAGFEMGEDASLFGLSVDFVF